MQGNEALPERIGRYQVEAELGRGMMGVVYRAVDPLLGRPVAVKVIRLGFPVSEAERESFEKRFMAEGRLVARLAHPGIVTVHDVGRDEELGTPYLALEYLVGRTLAEIMEEGDRPDWRTCVDIIARLARALHHAHARDVVHRDIKPANIMIKKDGTPKLMDFGIARPQAGFGLTATGQFMGTPLFMSPEQALGEAVDGRSDLFCLASVAYSALTGRDAFDADSVPLILKKVATLQAPPVTSLNPELPPALDPVISRAMAKRPEARYADGQLLADDLEDVLLGEPPRHQGDHEAPRVTGGGTMVAVSTPQSAEPEPVEPEPAESEPVAAAASETAPPPRRGRWLRRLGLLTTSLLVLAALLYFSGFWNPLLRGLWEGDRAARQELATALEVAAGEAGARVGDGVETLGALIVEPDSSPPSIEEPLAPSRGAGRKASSRLSVSVEHDLPGGEVQLWVDEARVFRAALTAQAQLQPHPLVFERDDGGYLGILPIVPGARALRLRVETAGATFEATTSGVFERQRSRHLDVTLARESGAIALSWRSGGRGAEARSRAGFRVQLESNAPNAGGAEREEE